MVDIGRGNPRTTLASQVGFLCLTFSALSSTWAVTGKEQAADKQTYATTLTADRWLEDWSWIAPDETMPLKLKNLQFPPQSKMTLSLGGESRLRAESRDAMDFDLTRADSLETANLRLLLHGNLTMANRVRVFMQVGSWDQIGRESPRIFDESTLVLQRGFFDWQVSNTTNLRLGRQDVLQSASRLLIPVDVFNAQLVHDAVALHYRSGSLRGRLFLGKRFYADRGVFDTRDFGRAELAGMFVEGGFKRLPGFDFGLYWLSEWSDFGLFPQRAGPERRQTAIVRQTWRKAPWAVSGEFGVQNGTIDRRDIHAWAFASEITRQFALPGAIALTLRVDGASGNRAGTQASETWATFHPIMAYLGRGGDYGATNAIGIYPEVSFEPIRGLRASLGGEWVWRASSEAA